MQQVAMGRVDLDRVEVGLEVVGVALASLHEDPQLLLLGLGQVNARLQASQAQVVPEATIFVEVGPERAYYFVANEKGAGGLPLGSQGRAVTCGHA